MRLSEVHIKELVTLYFPNFEPKGIDVFLAISTYGKAKNKEIIFKSGRSDKTLLLILIGSARAYQISKEGKEITNHIRSEGHIFGEALVFSDQLQMLDIEAIGEVHYLKFDVGELEQLCYKNDELMKFYLGFLKDTILVFSHRINSFVAMTPKERYLDLIKWNPKYLESTFDKHIAGFLGVTPLTIHRIKKSK
ncbi:Crp/Fnr family transcriptional regulator [Flavobacterium sp.]|jgi:CRP-like cAMP-binding protein|uniref:Crp/Fnr family transcriptional regulator n=1 Tax=Flavobacterium sp. TaxID=239 RepID=UPI0037C0F2C0